MWVGCCVSITRITSPSKHFYHNSNRFYCLMFSLFHPNPPLIFLSGVIPCCSWWRHSHHHQYHHHHDRRLCRLHKSLHPTNRSLRILALIVIKQTSCPKKIKLKMSRGSPKPIERMCKSERSESWGCWCHTGIGRVAGWWTLVIFRFTPYPGKSLGASLNCN